MSTYPEWRTIESAPKDRSILLYWPSYAYNLGEKGSSLIAIGHWKENPRLRGQPTATESGSVAPAYFADTSEMDDYGLGLPQNAPTHWMPLPPAPSEKGNGG